jgi:hypothetical protein
MTIPFYVPGFSHVDWIDNVDRVQAAGEKGLNIRFHALETEFANLARDQINPLIGALSRPAVKLTLIPALTAYADLAANQVKTGWLQGVDHVRKLNQQTEAHGTMSIALPLGTQIKSLQVTGSKPSGTLAVVLQRHKFDNSEGSQAVITATDVNQVFTPPPPPSPPELSVVAADYRYYLGVDLTGATGTDSVQIFSIQVIYQ